LKIFGKNREWKCGNKKNRVEENGEQIMKKNLERP
jgi:hypothetical protein